MKKKIIFAVATVFNMNVLQSNSAGDVSLESITVMAQAQSGESNINPDCINGCIEGTTSCICYDFYVNLAEYEGW